MSNNIEISNEILFNKTNVGTVSIVFLDEKSDLSDKVIHLKGAVAEIFLAISEGVKIEDILKNLQNMTKKTEQECKAFFDKFISDMEKLVILKVNQ